MDQSFLHAHLSDIKAPQKGKQYINGAIWLSPGAAHSASAHDTPQFLLRPLLFSIIILWLWWYPVVHDPLFFKFFYSASASYLIANSN